MGIALDHESRELLALPDYHGLYKAELRRLHRARPLPADSRLWKAEEIAFADGQAFGQDAAAVTEIHSRHSEQVPAMRLKAGAR